MYDSLGSMPLILPTLVNIESKFDTNYRKIRRQLSVQSFN